MHSRIKAVVRVQHAADTYCRRSGRQALRYPAVLACTEATLDVVTLNLITCNLQHVDYGSWVEIEGDMEEGTRGAMVDIVTDSFDTIQNPEPDISASATISVYGRLHGKYLRMEECMILESRGEHNKYFVGVPYRYLARPWLDTMNVGDPIKVAGELSEIRQRTDDSGVLLWLHPSLHPCSYRDSESPVAANHPLPQDIEVASSVSIETDSSLSDSEDLRNAARYTSPPPISPDHKLDYPTTPSNGSRSRDDARSAPLRVSPRTPSTPRNWSTRQAVGASAVGLPSPPETPSTQAGSRLKKFVRPTGRSSGMTQRPTLQPDQAGPSSTRAAQKSSSLLSSPTISHSASASSSKNKRRLQEPAPPPSTKRSRRE